MYNEPWDAWKETLWSYWGSILIAVYTILFGCFVFLLCAFHTYIISLNLTTYEKLKHNYDRFP